MALNFVADFQIPTINKSIPCGASGAEVSRPVGPAVFSHCDRTAPLRTISILCIACYSMDILDLRVTPGNERAFFVD